MREQPEHNGPGSGAITLGGGKHTPPLLARHAQAPSPYKEGPLVHVEAPWLMAAPRRDDPELPQSSKRRARLASSSQTLGTTARDAASD